MITATHPIIDINRMFICYSDSVATVLRLDVDCFRITKTNFDFNMELIMDFNLKPNHIESSMNWITISG